MIDFRIVDEETGTTFIVDVEGQKYIVPNELPNMGVPSITISGLIITISGIDIFNEVTVSGINNFEYEEVYMQGHNLSNFSNNNSFHSLPDTTYLVLANELLHITAVTAAQSKPSLSVVGLYRDGIREREIPMREDFHVVFPMPIKYYEGETFQIRFKPGDKKTRFQIFVDGYIMEE